MLIILSKKPTCLAFHPRTQEYPTQGPLITGQIPRKYKSAKTIAAAIEKGAARGDIMNDFKTLGPMNYALLLLSVAAL